ncbi:MAG: YsnF/AvaK domain-containing protein [Proteobacteria bacterium]|nr:YsnF/AvaK domain-containing protein [Pseudomonadota bacterium]
MAYETIVAVFDSADHAEQAVRDLEAAGIPSTAISRHAGRDQSATATTTTAQSREEPGFWARLFGEEPEYEREGSMYDRSMELGSSVVTVKVSEEHVVHVTDILERHNPIDLDERAAGWGEGSDTGRVGSDLHGAAAGVSGTRAGVRTDTDTSATMASGVSAGTTGRSMTDRGVAGREETIPLAEEQIAVGKRAINRGTTRVRRYVVETPVEETVSLRDETVSIDRRPVTGERAVGGADFSEKVVEVSETTEEPVVSKSARVREEVVINKQANERTETVRDTVRREDVEITKDADARTTGTAAANRTKR